MTLYYTLQFFDYWHTGSGLSGGTYADQVVNKTSDGLPIVPGKTIKGLLRHAAEDLLYFGDPHFSQESINAIFGASAEERRPDKAENDPAEGTDSILPDPRRITGNCWFSSAELPTLVARDITDSLRPQLYEVLASTKIKVATGTAEDGSLRQMEVTVPLVLTGHISGLKDGQRETLQRCLHYVKRLGQNRSRGLGRCQFNLLAQ
jgi:CRISPR/Cas system CSM-associated protein Csm3 (group 7 of RAMP superfamily)